MDILKIPEALEGENLTPRVVEFLCDGGKQKKLIFEKGRYDFYSFGTYSGVFYPSNNLSGEKTVVFPMLNLEGIEIDGNGSTFVFHDRIFPFIGQNSNNLVLKNFTIDFSFPRYAHGKVLACDDDGFTLYLDKTQFPYDVNERGNIIFKTGGTRINSAEKCFFMQSRSRGCGVFYAEIGETIVPLKSKCEGVDLVAVRASQNGENVVRFSYKEKSPKRDIPIGDIVVINNDEDRENAGFFFDRCQNVLLTNVTVHRVAGMGVVAQLSKDIIADELNFCVPNDGRSDLVSATADALHFINCYGKVQVKNSCVKDTVDDAFNSHGNYMRVERVQNDKVYLRFCHFEQEGRVNLYSEGDTIAVTDGASEREKGLSTIKNSCFEGEFVVIETNGAVVIGEGDYIENKTKTPEILLENNVFINEPHLRFSGPRRIVIKNNRFENVICPIFINDLLDWFKESGAVTDVTVEGNVFIKTSRPIDIGIARKEGHNVFHKNVVIKNNFFAEDNGSELFVTCADGFVFEDNTCLFTNDVKNSIKITNCKNVRIK